jgi:hypothetical protein
MGTPTSDVVISCDISRINLLSVQHHHRIMPAHCWWWSKDNLAVPLICVHSPIGDVTMLKTRTQTSFAARVCPSHLHESALKRVLKGKEGQAPGTPGKTQQSATDNRSKKAKQKPTC